MKQLYKISLVIYVLFLSWLVLFKFSADPLSVLANYQSSSLNLVPFKGYSLGTRREMIDNFVVFVPLGLLLGMNFLRVAFWRKLTCIFVLSTTAEVIQFVFAIGTTDITDVITNTLGGLFGLVAYDLISKHANAKKFNLFIVITLGVLLTIFTLLRFLVFRVRY